MHYKNGRLAREGDIVYGKSYNRVGERVGVMAIIKPGQESCNCVVAFSLSVLPIGYSDFVMSTKRLDNGACDLDYSQVDNYLHIDDYLASLLPQVIQGDQVPEVISGEASTK